MKMAKYTGVTTASTANADSSNSLTHSVSRRDRIVDQVIIGTPGTLKRWMTRDKILDTRSIKILVFDEADQMLDQVINYASHILASWQILLHIISATFF